MTSDYDAIIVGASFAGLAVARRLRGRILLLDRHEVGAVQTSTCGTPLWVPHAVGVEESVLQVHEKVVVHAPTGTVVFDVSDVPYCTFDYRKFCRGLQAVAATLAGAITYLAQMAQWAAIFGGSRRDDGRGGGNPVALLMMAILAPIAALLVLAISRARQFQADASGAKLAGRTSGPGRALAKLAAAPKTARLDAHPATAHLFIVNPLNGQALTRLFSTHPPVEERSARLRAMRV